MLLKTEKGFIIFFALTLSLMSIAARLKVLGWMFLLGIGSSFIFGTMHLFLIVDLIAQFNSMNRFQKILSWLCVLSLPPVFLFQFDFSDAPGTYFGYEFFTGFDMSKPESSLGYLAVYSGIIYISAFAILKIKMKKLNKKDNPSSNLIK